MYTTLVINAKGGAGKTTIATNLASFFASRNVPTTIADYDPQGSSLNWLRLRSTDRFRIHGADLSPRAGTVSGPIAGRRHIPQETEQLIIDAPGGASRLLLQDLLARTQCILIPVAPSSIDVHATANFIKELLLVGMVRIRRIRMAIVANRVSSSRRDYAPLAKFIASLRITFLASVSNSELYVDAAENGLGVFEVPPDQAIAEQAEFLPIAEWVMDNSAAAVPPTMSNVVEWKPPRAARAVGQ
jgi:chromosome partitioning protein